MTNLGIAPGREKNPEQRFHTESLLASPRVSPDDESVATIELDQAGSWIDVINAAVSRRVPAEAFQYVDSLPSRPPSRKDRRIEPIDGLRRGESRAVPRPRDS